jgi:hydroxypyruvate isomerase
MDRKRFLAMSGAGALGLSALGTRRARAAEEMTEAEAHALGKNDLKIALQPRMFGGRDFLKQIEQVAYYGYPAFEQLGTGGVDIEATRAKMDELGLVWTCIGANIGSIGRPNNWKQGLGISSLEEHDNVERSFRERLGVAKKLNIKRLLGLTGQKRQDMSPERQTEIIVTGLKRLAPIAEDNDVTIVLEILNTKINHPGYFLVYTPQGAEIMQEVDSPNVKLLYDIYHQQISEGNLINNITKNIQYIGHFHIGDNPGRQQPGTGEINYRNVFKAIHGTDYDGYLSMECGYTIPPAEVCKLMHELTTFS